MALKLRCLTSIFGIRLIIFFLVTSAFSRRYLVEMLVIWWHLYPWWPFVAFCGLLWPLGVFAWWFAVQSVTSMDSAVFCGICNNYDIYGGSVGLQCISNFSADFHTISWFFSKIWMFWMEYDILVWSEADFMVVSMISVWIWILAWSFWFFGAFGSSGRCHAKSAGEKYCRWEGAIAHLAVFHIAGEKVPSQCRRW